MPDLKDDAYRDAVRRWCDGVPLKNLDNITVIVPVPVDPHANVHKTFGGAFVELQVWVPNAAAETKA